MDKEGVGPDFIGDLISEGLDECLRRGMHEPFIIVVVGLNGVIFAARVPANTADPAEVLVDCADDAIIAVPINVMIVDRTGEAARVVVTATGKTWH
jgi:hypothetical protein